MMENTKEKIRSINLKKAIKGTTLIVGLTLIIFISFYNASFDFYHLNWYEWLANTSILVGIMIFGILMGNSTGTDIQQEKVGGLYQQNCIAYNEISLEIEPFRIYFSQWWLIYKERKLIEKKIEYLVDNQFELREATFIVKNIEKEDLEVGKLIYDENDPTNKIYVKNNIKCKKIYKDQVEHVEHIFTLSLNTFGESYYLSLLDDDDFKVNEAEKGKRIAEKIARDKRRSYGLKISSSLIISVVWAAITVNELMDGGDEATRKAWLNLISRLSALITSYLSGFSTSVINVRDKARAIENKTDILKHYKAEYDNKTFIPETYEQMIEREYQEQQKVIENKVEVCDNNNVPNVG